jgi:predicted TIM-barrel fold metal-dependent hydrolase
MHFYHPKFPTAPDKTPPADAWVENYQEVQKALGLQRVVAIQPTAYGRDNSCQLAAMAAFGDNARGVMVVDETTPEAELERMTKLGARGARFHMLPGGAVPWTSWRKWRPACIPSAGTSSCSSMPRTARARSPAEAPAGRAGGRPCRPLHAAGQN